MPQPTALKSLTLVHHGTLTPCILDDVPEQLRLLSEMISEIGYDALQTSDPEEALRLVQSGACCLLITDVHLPGADAYAFLDPVLSSDPGVYVIVITAKYTLESALEAIRRGATDFLPKPVDRLGLKRVLDDVAGLHDQRRRVRSLEQLLRDQEFQGIVGKSPVMLEVFDFARKVARHYTNVLLVGPTGTGKELVAAASQQRLAVCNCSAMVDTLLESQLFGHMRGPSPAPPKPVPACSNMPTAAPCFSTKWARLPSPCRPNSYAPKSSPGAFAKIFFIA